MNSSMYAWWRCTNRMSPFRTGRSSITSVISFHQSVIMAVHPLARYDFAVAVQISAASWYLSYRYIGWALNLIWIFCSRFSKRTAYRSVVLKIPACVMGFGMLRRTCVSVRHLCSPRIEVTVLPCRGLDMIHILNTHYSLEITVRTEQ